MSVDVDVRTVVTTVYGNSEVLILGLVCIRVQVWVLC